MIFLSDAELGGEILLQPNHQLLHGGIDLRVLQSPLSILHNYTECKTFFALIDPFSSVDVKEFYFFDQGWKRIFQSIQNLLEFQFLIHNDRQVAQHRRLFRDFIKLGQCCLLENVQIQFENDRSERQIIFLLPLRVQFAEMADDNVVDDDFGTTPRMERRVRRFLETGDLRCEQQLDLAFDVEEIDISSG